MSVSQSADLDGPESLELRLAPFGSLVAPVLDALRAISPPGETPLVVRFAELFLGDATAEFFMERSSETVAALVLSAFRPSGSP